MGQKDKLTKKLKSRPKDFTSDEADPYQAKQLIDILEQENLI